MITKTISRFFVVMLVISSLFATSCRNANQVKQVIKYTKPYWDDLVNAASKSSTKTALNLGSRYTFTQAEMLAARIAFNTRLPIYNSAGQQVSYAIGESSVAATEGSFQQDFYIMLEKTIELLKRRQIYHY